MDFARFGEDARRCAQLPPRVLRTYGRDSAEAAGAQRERMANWGRWVDAYLARPGEVGLDWVELSKSWRTGDRRHGGDRRLRLGFCRVLSQSPTNIYACIVFVMAV